MKAKEISKYSFGIGDRFGYQGEPLLRALTRAKEKGVEITPTWNKSNREHNIIGSEPEDTRKSADSAIRSQGWDGAYFVDADHINFDNVDRFVQHSDFFTLDVASYIGAEPSDDEINAFIKSCDVFESIILIPGVIKPIEVSNELLLKVSKKYLTAIKEAGRIYRHIESIKGKGNFITEISMDEVSSPQTPVELLFILKMIANEGIPIQTIAPRFSGRFNKGVDYIGDIDQFSSEFEQDILVIYYAVKEFGLPENLKLSVHSGSDKFAIYPIIRNIIKKYDKGLHVKTAGTSWLEEVIGLAISGHEGLRIAKEIYARSWERKEELCAPYADVIDIDYSELPLPEKVEKWDGKRFSESLRHIALSPCYNSDFRQLIHVGYKIAAEMGYSYTGLLDKYADVIGKCVEENIYERHLKRLFDL